MAGKPSTASRKNSAPLAQEAATDNSWSAARPRTLVDHAVDAILSAASRGLILPGDRIAEPELVAKLGMSRVPIREALRILESQGIVTSEPYKGIRLMEISHQRLEQIIDVRIPLETLACRRAIEAGRNSAEQLNQLYQGVAQMQAMMQNDDVYGFASADTDFHRTLCSFAHNPVLSNLWESIARQLTVIFGLSTMGKSMSDIIEEHQRLINVFADGDIAKMTDEVENHIRIQALDVDYETLITQRRQHRSALG
ncbi:GntR family transcriptional regulator [Pantoea sp. BIGb0393]|uniref:GntR family transcriptional regulator n=1 Tax=Pantoea nemavictus TaxID=2726955 RepID=A0ABU8PUA6_9GAMM|nr:MULTISPECIES: GntR family transcriptional regulator [Pantoea]EJL81630.1 transcriptional regulator [Pantoea sp. GM01]MBA0036544.1 GntR family transcriptional regulator [Pantoea nemavictus]